MCTDFRNHVIAKTIFLKYLITISLILGFTAQQAHALLIDFDDITRIETEGCFCDHPLTDQYALKGLLISDEYLSGEINPDNATIRPGT